MTIELTEAEYTKYQEDLARRYKAIVLPKDMIGVQQVAAVFGVLSSFLDVPNEHSFLHDFATSIGPFVFMPEEWPVKDKKIVLAHELVHVGQFWDDPVRFPWLYLTHKESQVKYESWARVTEYETHHLFGEPTGTSAESSARFKHGYGGVAEEQLTYSADIVDSALLSLSEGVIQTPVGRSVQGWLRGAGKL